LIHLAFNMMALRQIGPITEREYGVSRTLVVYTGGGVAGFAVSCVAGVPFTIGASAAVCGLIGAMLFYGKTRGGTYGQAIYRQLGGWVLSLFVFGLLFPGINNWAHGGGLVAGAALGWLLGYQETRRETSVHRLLGAICAVLTLAVLVWGVGTALLLKFAR
jgi:rhomboid protease GluP